MIRMKKVISIGTVLVMLLSLCACGRTEKATSSDEYVAHSTTETSSDADADSSQTTETAGQSDEDASLSIKNARDIPEELEVISAEYRKSAAQEGVLVKLDYETWESFSYDQHSQKLLKTAWVYLPYGYDESQAYNIFYLSHGGWSNEETVLGTDRQPSELKYAVDHAIQDGRIKPVILVCPTYNNTSGRDSWDPVQLYRY